jgi:hypothetical protein
MSQLLRPCRLFLAILLASALIRAQTPTSQPVDVLPTPTADHPAAGHSTDQPAIDYPMDRPGIFIQGSTWKDIAGEIPTKTKAAHSIAAGLSYGLVPAKVVAEYEGDHAPTQVEPGQPALCICHILSLPGQPAIVRLHPKKNARELDGGKMIVYPVVGGSKMADANKSDLIPVDVSHPDPQVWIVRPQLVLTPGEYALMLGTQNINIYPFTVAAPSPASNQSK